MNHMKRLFIGAFNVALMLLIVATLMAACARGPGGEAVQFDIPLVDVDQSMSCRQALRRLDDLNERWNDAKGRSAFSEGLIYDEQVRQLKAIISEKCDL